MTYNVMYHILSNSQSEREVHVNLLDYNTPWLSVKIDTQRTTA